MGTKLNPRVNIWELARPLIEDWMRDHFGPRATLARAAEGLAQGLRRLPRLIDSLHLIAERERREAERDAVPRPPEPGRYWPRTGFAEIVAVVALIAAVAAWWR
jgi:ubiquinone biosynthesis protein